MTTIKIEDIIKEWEAEGNDNHPKDPKLPLHPELFYRVSGQWKGWNDFLNTPTSSPDYPMHLVRDQMECEAWLIYKQKIN
jgi:hypothetical protein